MQHDTAGAEPADMTGERAAPASRARLRRVLPLAALAALMALAFQQGWHEELTLDAIIARRQAIDALIAGNLLVAIAGYVALYAAVVALSLPGGAILTIAGGLFLGLATGFLATIVGATVGATIVFLIARSALGASLRQSAGPWMARLSDGFREDAWSYLFFLRLVPLFPFWLVNLAPALFAVPLRTFVITTFFGIMPGTFAFTFFGAGLDSVIEAQIAANPDCAAGGACALSIDPGALLTPELIGAFVALGVVALIPVAVKRLRRARAA